MFSCRDFFWKLHRLHTLRIAQHGIAKREHRYSCLSLPAEGESVQDCRLHRFDSAIGAERQSIPTVESLNGVSFPDNISVRLLGMVYHRSRDRIIVDVEVREV